MHLSRSLPTFLYIPPAAFLMGTPESDLSNLAKRYGGTRESYREESPQHQISLPAFVLAQTPVTNALYGQYVAATDARAPIHWHGSQPARDIADHPVVDVAWEDVCTFCAWLTTHVSTVEVVSKPGSNTITITRPQFRLPSEAEWEHAARGTDGRAFPWGNTFDPAYANTREAAHYHTTPVEQYAAGASPYGVYDMAGNVWEWTESIDALYPYDPGDGREDAQASGRRIARGGCYANPQGFARCACRFRFATTVRNPFLGFRLALSYTP